MPAPQAAATTENARPARARATRRGRPAGPPPAPRTRPRSRPAGICDGAGTCSAPAATSCFPFRCGTAACKSTCTADADCAPPGVCVDGSCGLKPDGAVCGDGGECGSGKCAQGVCCRTDCAGSCLSCALPGSTGTCKPVAAARPRSSRAVPRSGGGQLRQQRSVRRRGRLPAVRGRHGMRAADLPGRHGDRDAGAHVRRRGNLQAGDGPVVRCPTPATARACRAACGGDSDCVGGMVCNAGSCGKKRLGQICAAGSECDSGNCVDGVCCSSASCGTCLSCNVTGSAGSCTPVPAGAMEPHGGCPSAPPCGFNGLCDGTGACRPMPAGTSAARRRAAGRRRRPPAAATAPAPAGRARSAARPTSVGRTRARRRARQRGLRPGFLCLGYSCTNLKANGLACGAARGNASAATAPRGSAADRRRAGPADRARSRASRAPARRPPTARCAGPAVRRQRPAPAPSTCSSGMCTQGTRVDCAPCGCNAAADARPAVPRTPTARGCTPAPRAAPATSASERER